MASGVMIHPGAKKGFETQVCGRLASVTGQKRKQKVRDLQRERHEAQRKFDS
jgi:hypothetical protein